MTLATCDSRCTDTRSDDRHCGRCFNACPTGFHCEEGRCTCPAPLALCGSQCIDTRTSRDHCGGCYGACPREATGCAEGVCVCSGARGAVCDRSCVDLASHRAHCGRCGNACDDATSCVDGACRPRRVLPAAGARVGSRRPTFRWTAGDGTVDVCADPGCARVLESFAGAAARGATPTRRLDPGVSFWRVRTSGVGLSDGGPAAPFRVDARDTAVPGLLPPALDINGDGLRDVVVVSAEPAAAVFLGTRGPLRVTPDRAFSLEGPLGTAWSALLAGDVSDDAFGDAWLLAGAANQILTGALSAGSLILREGRASRLRIPILDVNGNALADWIELRDDGAWALYESASGVLSGGPLPRAGTAARPETVAPLGDVNGDGLADVALGFPNAIPPEVYVYFGSSAGLDRAVALPPAPRTAGYGASVAGAGDVNGDGLADVLAGLGGAGAAVYLGGRDALALHRTLLSPTGDDLRVFAAGDVDGDGFGDVLAVPLARGEAWLYRGGAAGLAMTPLVLRDARWAAVETAGAPGDVDGDGFDDVVVGAPTADAVLVLHGAAGAAVLTRVETLRGAAGTEFGRSVL